MKVINLDKDMEDLFISKSIIESYWIEQEEISEKHSLNEFIDILNMENTIYNSNQNIYPFSIINTDKETFIFTVCDDPTELLNALKEIEYNVENLVKVTKEDLYINGILENNSFFIINNKVCLPKDTYNPSHKISDDFKLKYLSINKADIDNIIDETTKNMYDLENKL